MTKFMNALNLPVINRQFIGFDNLFNELNHIGDRVDNYPPYNIVKVDDTHHNIELAVAGFNEDELNVNVENKRLVVTGSKVLSEPTEYVHKGISSKSFTIQYRLGQYVEVTGASVKNGIMTISLEESVPEVAKPKAIAISFN